MNKENENKPDSIIMEPDTTYSPLFWDEEGIAIGDYDLFFIGDEEYLTSSIKALKSGFIKLINMIHILMWLNSLQKEWKNG